MLVLMKNQSLTKCIDIGSCTAEACPNDLLPANNYMPLFCKYRKTTEHLTPGIKWLDVRIHPLRTDAIVQGRAVKRGYL